MKNYNTTEPLLYHKFNTCNHVNIDFNFKYPKFEKFAIENFKKYEGPGNAYFNIVRKDDKIKMYYRSVDHPVWMDKNKKNSYDGSILRNYQYLCIAESSDGLNFEKPDLNLCEYEGNKKNNILFKNYFCHNFCVIYDNKINKYLGITGSQFDIGGLFLFKSDNGYNWDNGKIILSEDKLISGYAHANHFDTLNYLLYNPKTNKYYLYTRHNHPTYRKVQMSISDDLINFSNCELVNFNIEDHVYATGFELYPTSSNYFIGLISTHCQTTYYKKVSLCISIDGINWEIIIKDLFQDLKISHFLVKGIICTDKFYLYTSEFNDFDNNKVLCYSFEKDRIGYLTSDSTGYFNSKIIELENSNIYINYETESDGYIIVELFDLNNNLILSSENMIGNYELNQIVWKENKNIIKDKYYLKFTIYKAKIYSFYY